jgi:murein L,D-transpeptidase YcbB/YkuD
MNPELEARLRRFGASVDAAADAAEARRAADPLRPPPVLADVSALEPVEAPPRRQPHSYRALAVAAATAAVAIAVGVVARSPSPDGTTSPAGDSAATTGVAASADVAASAPAPVATTAPPSSSSTSTAPTTTPAPAIVVCPSYRPNDTLPLRLCDKGDAVRAVQQRLREVVVADLLVDGYLGPTTEQAVRTFQRLHGLDVDGLVGPATWSALFAGAAQPPVTGATAG